MKEFFSEVLKIREVIYSKSNTILPILWRRYQFALAPNKLPPPRQLSKNNVFSHHSLHFPKLLYLQIWNKEPSQYFEKKIYSLIFFDVTTQMYFT